MKGQWQNYRKGNGWILVLETEVIWGTQPGGMSLSDVARCTRNWRNFNRHMNTTMRYW